LIMPQRIFWARVLQYNVSTRFGTLRAGAQIGAQIRRKCKSRLVHFRGIQLAAKKASSNEAPPTLRSLSDVLAGVPGTASGVPRLRPVYHQEMNLDMMLWVGGTAVIMMGAAYASVPLYQSLCKKFGWGGTVVTNTREKKDLMRLLSYQQTRNQRAKDRRFLIKFNTQVNPGMQWYFEPTQDYVVVRPGETALAFFTAYNDSPNPITGVSTYNILPYTSAPYFRKVQCFCFEEQRLRGKEKVDMPVLFYLDPEILGDKTLKDCYDINLSYTFFEVEEEQGPVEWDDDDDFADEMTDDFGNSIESKPPKRALNPINSVADNPDNNPIELIEQNTYHVEPGERGMARTVGVAHESRNTPGLEKFRSSWERALGSS